MTGELPTHEGVTRDAALRAAAPTGPLESANPSAAPTVPMESGNPSAAPTWLVERGVLLRLAYRFCWNGSDAEDAVQEALLRAVEQWRSGVRPDRPAAWLKAIVVRQSIEANRRGGRRERLVAGARLAMGGGSKAAPGLAVGATDGASGAELADRSAALRELVEELPERQRIALVLRHLDEMEFGEIADVMEISESTVRVLVRNGREGLRDLMFQRTPGLLPENR